MYENTNYIFLVLECTDVAGILADIVFVLDSSGSIEYSGSGNWNMTLDFLVNIVNRLRIGIIYNHVGVVSYSRNSKVNFPLNWFYTKQNLVDAIRRIPYIGLNTNTAAAIEDMRTQVFTQRGDRPYLKNFGILVTDGESNINQEDTIPNANKAKNDGIIMFAVGITERINATELIEISSNGVELQTYWVLAGFNQMRDIVDKIITQICDVPCQNESNVGKFEI